MWPICSQCENTPGSRVQRIPAGEPDEDLLKEVGASFQQKVNQHITKFHSALIEEHELLLTELLQRFESDKKAYQDAQVCDDQVFDEVKAVPYNVRRVSIDLDDPADPKRDVRSSERSETKVQIEDEPELSEPNYLSRIHEGPSTAVIDAGAIAPTLDLRDASNEKDHTKGPIGHDVGNEKDNTNPGRRSIRASNHGARVGAVLSTREERMEEDTFEMLEKVELGRQESIRARPANSTMRPLYLFFGPDIFVQSVFDFIVISNVIVLGFQPGSSWDGWLVVDSLYACVFIGEIAHKVWSRGLSAFNPRKDDAKWAWFDVLLAGLSVFDVTIAYIDSSSAESSNINWLRIARLVRIARILRLVQLEIFRDLLLMINGAVGGVRTLLWSIILITVPIYVFALFFTEMVGLQESKTDNLERDVRPYFETVGASMFTGFRCLVVGDCTTDYGTPIFLHLVGSHGWSYGVIYSLTSVCMSFGLFNVIVAIYVENTVAAAKSNEMIQRQRRLEDRARFAEKVINLVHFLWRQQYDDVGHFEIHTAMGMELDEDFFQTFVGMPEFHMLLEDLDIPSEDHKDLFEICDADGSGVVSMAELVSGVRRLRGDPRRSDLVYVMLRIRQLLTEVQDLKELDDHTNWAEVNASKSFKHSQEIAKVFSATATGSTGTGRITAAPSRTSSSPRASAPTNNPSRSF